MKLATLVSLGFSLCLGATSLVAGEMPDGTSKEAIDKQDAWVRVDWPYLSQFIDKYPGYKAAAYCQASFTHERYFEGAILLVDPQKRTGLYVAVIGNGPKAAKVVELGKISVAFTDEWRASLKCESYTGLLRLDAEISAPNSLIEGGIKPISTLDGICVWYGDEHRDSPPNVCYGYDRKKQAFVEIGGWLT